VGTGFVGGKTKIGEGTDHHSIGRGSGVLGGKGEPVREGAEKERKRWIPLGRVDTVDSMEEDSEAA